MHAKVFREGRVFLFQEGPEGAEGTVEEREGMQGKMQTCLFVCLCRSVLSGCVCMFVFAWERKRRRRRRKRRRDDGRFH